MADALESTGINLPLGVIMRYYIDCEFDDLNKVVLCIAELGNIGEVVKDEEETPQGERNEQ